jgi:hypothetical protein
MLLSSRENEPEEVLQDVPEEVFMFFDEKKDFHLVKVFVQDIILCYQIAVLDRETSIFDTYTYRHIDQVAHWVKLANNAMKNTSDSGYELNLFLHCPFCGVIKPPKEPCGACGRGAEIHETEGKFDEKV